MKSKFIGMIGYYKSQKVEVVELDNGWVNEITPKFWIRYLEGANKGDEFTLSRRTVSNIFKEGWVKPDWKNLIEDAKNDFRCGECQELKPWQTQWDSSQLGVCSICDDCKNEMEKK